MRTQSVFFSALLGCGLLVSAPSAASAQDSNRVARPISSFGLDVFRRISLASAEPNVVFSPLSVGLAVALLAEGAAGETRAELLLALGTTESRWPRYQTDIRALLADLNADTTAVTRIASSVWGDEGRQLSHRFMERAETFHLATVKAVDLQTNAAGDIVNRWASEATAGRIARVMPPPRPDLALLLLNAVYFKGMWQTVCGVHRRTEIFVGAGLGS